MIHKKTKYALKALLALAGSPEHTPMHIADLASAEGIPKKFLEAILLELKNHGILHSKKGRGGGYQLSRPPQTVMLGDVIRIVSGPLAPIRCASETRYRRCEDCPREDFCGVRAIMKEVRNSAARFVDRTSLAAAATHVELLKTNGFGADMYYI